MFLNHQSKEDDTQFRYLTYPSGTLLTFLFRPRIPDAPRDEREDCQFSYTGDYPCYGAGVVEE
jgi:hypothetical protein